QFARWSGAHVLATVSSEAKADVARALGADATIDYTRENVPERVQALTQGQGIDRIIEVDFGANLAVDHAVIKTNGVIASYPSTRDPTPSPPYYAFARKGVTLHFVQGRYLPEAARAAAARDITALLHRDLLTHPETIHMPLADVATAHEAVESGSL